MCVSEIAVITGSDGRTVPLSEPGTVVVYRDMVPARSGDSNYMRCAPAKASSAEFASWAITQRQDYEDLIDDYDEVP